jgi:hypothetical protein
MIWGFHQVTVEVPGRWIIYSWHFKEMDCPHLQGYEWIHGIITAEMKRVYSFEASGSIYPTILCHTQKTCFLNMKTGLQLIKCCSTVSCSVGSAASSPHNISAISFTVVFLSLSLCLITQATRCLGVLWATCHGGEGGILNACCWEITITDLCVCYICMLQMVRYGRNTLEACPSSRCTTQSVYKTKY